MPELPDVAVYIEALESRIVGHPLERVRIGTPFLVRTVKPPLSAVHGQRVARLQRAGKRIAIGLENGIWLVIHLMIAGRLHWSKANAKLPGKRGLAAFDFDNGTLILTEAGSQRRASLHVLETLEDADRGGLEVLDATLEQFTDALRRENHTLKRSLTDPRLFSGIGNAYSDEILHAAKLSPVTWTSRLTDAEIAALYRATQQTMLRWIARLRDEAKGGFPEGVTAFREGMAAHGRYGLPCPDCGEKIQRIRYADNETNYCPKCQTGGKLLADRALSRLLGADWPKSLEELESLKQKPEANRP